MLKVSLLPLFTPAFSMLSALLSPKTLGQDNSPLLEKRNEALYQLFETTEAAEDTSIVIDTPIEAEHPTYVPFKITAVGAQKLAIFVEPSNAPLAAVFTLHPACGHSVKGTVDMQEGSTISCYALKNDQLFRSSRYIRIGINGYES